LETPGKYPEILRVLKKILKFKCIIVVDRPARKLENAWNSTDIANGGKQDQIVISGADNPAQ